ncbi:MAG: hypothetical protein WD689_02430 [Gaiellaceae bacterium]
MRRAADGALPLIAFVASMALLIGLLALLGYDASVILTALWEGSMGSPSALSTSLGQAVPIILTAAAFWLTVSAGVFNIGMDGQLQLGGLATLLVAFALVGVLPALLVIVVGVAAGALAGALWSALAGVPKITRGTNEIVSTLMLNFVAFVIVGEMMRGALQSETNRLTPQTDKIDESLHITSTIGGAQFSWGIVIAIAFTVALLGIVLMTSLGLRLRAIGLNAEAARHAAIPIPRYWHGVFLCAGALSGIAGALVILGLRFHIAPGWAPLWGFQGVLVTFLALRRPWLIPLWGVLFGMLAAAGPALKGSASVPDSIVTVMITLPVIVLYLLYALQREPLSWLPRLRAAGPSRAAEAQDG